MPRPPFRSPRPPRPSPRCALLSLISAVIVGSFEHQLATHILIAFFLPGVVYLADAIGTQTEALVIRGMSAGVPVRRVAARESVTGVVLGLPLAALAFPVIALFWGDATVALVVGLALLAASSIATVVAMGLPWLIQRLGHDPVFGSGSLGHRRPGPPVGHPLLRDRDTPAVLTHRHSSAGPYAPACPGRRAPWTRTAPCGRIQKDICSSEALHQSRNISH